MLVRGVLAGYYSSVLGGEVCGCVVFLSLVLVLGVVAFVVAFLWLLVDVEVPRIHPDRVNRIHSIINVL